MQELNLINKLKGLAEFTGYFFLHCSNVEKDRPFTEIDVLKANFCRYTKRTMYYAENFIKSYETVQKWIKKKEYYDNEKAFMTQIADNIYFDFDAFLFSCKSLIEKKIMDRSKAFHPKVKNEFQKYARGKFDNFIKTYMTPLRDEVVHVNNFGSSIGSMAKVENGEIEILGFDHSRNLELKKVFNKILEEMSEIIEQIAKFIMYHESYSYGFPTKDITFKTRHCEYKISDYIKIPKR